MDEEILSMQRRSNIVNTSVPFVVYIILIIPFIYEASLPNLKRRILSDNSNKRNKTWRLKYLEMEDGTNTISDFALLPLSLILSKVQQSVLDWGLLSGGQY